MSHREFQGSHELLSATTGTKASEPVPWFHSVSFDLSLGPRLFRKSSPSTWLAACRKDSARAGGMPSSELAPEGPTGFGSHGPPLELLGKDASMQKNSGVPSFDEGSFQQEPKSKAKRGIWMHPTGFGYIPM